MSLLLAAVGALLLEHFRPLTHPPAHYRLFCSYSDWLRDKLDGGETQQGLLAWSAAVLPVVAVIFAVHFWLEGLSPVLGALFDGIVLYATGGFKYYASAAAEVASALAARDLDRARVALTRWGNVDSAQFGEHEVASVATERLLALSHRQLFAPLLWFVVLGFAGPIGPVLYRLSSILSHRWGETDSFGRAARRAFYWLNWPAAHITAASFAVAGDFEDAVYCWRTQATQWPDAEEGLVLAAGGGALGVVLGTPLPVGSAILSRPELGLGDAAEAQHIASATSLVWRALALWLILGVLFVVAGLAG